MNWWKKKKKKHCFHVGELALTSSLQIYFINVSVDKTESLGLHIHRRIFNKVFTACDIFLILGEFIQILYSFLLLSKNVKQGCPSVFA